MIHLLKCVFDLDPNAALDEQPRGVLAAVFLDPENPLGSTEESMESFEWDQVVVEG